MAPASKGLLLLLLLLLGEVKDETTFRYAHAEIRTQVVVICGPTSYR